MLCSKDDRINYLMVGRCPDCNGCIDDQCWGCSRRWCSGMYIDRICDRCPRKVDKTITDGAGNERVIRVRCNADAGHDHGCHWNASLAARK